SSQIEHEPRLTDLQSRARLSARLGEWSSSDEDELRLVDQQPSELRRRARVAYLAMLAGDRQKYENERPRLVGKTPAHVHFRDAATICQASLLLPGSFDRAARIFQSLLDAQRRTNPAQADDRLTLGFLLDEGSGIMVKNQVPSGLPGNVQGKAGWVDDMT